MQKVFIALLGLCLSCNQQASHTTTIPTDSAPADGTELNDTAPVGPDTTLQPKGARPPQGIYRLVLPGRVEHTLAFYPNHRYRLEERRKAVPSRSEGEWASTGDELWLYHQGVAVGKYRWKGDTLVYLLKDNTYPLERLVSAMDNDVWRNKKREGIEFFGIGNEPFWNVEVDEQKAIAFHLSDWSHPQRFPPARPIASGDSLLYATANDSATLRVVVYHRFCNDGMSDYTYDQQVKVVYNSKEYNGCGLLFR